MSLAPLLIVGGSLQESAIIAGKHLSDYYNEAPVSFASMSVSDVSTGITAIQVCPGWMEILQTFSETFGSTRCTGHATVAFYLRLGAVLSVYTWTITTKDGHWSTTFSSQKAVLFTNCIISDSTHLWKASTHAVIMIRAIFFLLVLTVSIWSSMAYHNWFWTPVASLKRLPGTASESFKL